MEILHREEIPKHHILKRWTRDARDILPRHLVQYQKDNSVNLSFTCRYVTLYFKAMKVVQMGDASAACYDHMHAGLEALLLNGAPLAEKRDGLTFEDRSWKATLTNAIVLGHSVSMNAPQGLAGPDKHRGAGRPTNNREKAPYKGLSKRNQILQHLSSRRPQKDHVPGERGRTEKATKTQEMQELRDRRTSTKYLQAATWFCR